MMLIERMRTKLVRCGAVIAMIATGLATMPAEPAEVRSETGAPDATLALVGGRLVDGYGGHPLDHAVILVSGDRIAAIGSREQVDVPQGAEVLDVSGMTVLPGLWESHGHLFHIGGGRPTEFQQKFAPQTREIMAQVARGSNPKRSPGAWVPPSASK
jgi:imidazolonepropionase-like amidohydrolase